MSRAIGKHARGERAAAIRLQKFDVDAVSLPSFKLHLSLKGASSHLDYQEIIKAAAEASATRYTSKGDGGKVFLKDVFRDMQWTVAEKCIEICKKHISASIKNRPDFKENPEQSPCSYA